MPAKKQRPIVRHATKVLVLKEKPLIPLLILAAFGIGFLTHFLINVIFAETQSDGKIHACVSKNGDIRMIVDAKRRKFIDDKGRGNDKYDKDGCRENEVAVEWDIQGPPGSSGGGTNTSSGNSFPFVCPSCDLSDSIEDRLAGKNLTDAVMPDAVLSSVNFTGTNFTHANLKGTDFGQANLSNVNFENADLQGSKMNTAKVEGVQWKNTICPDGTNSNDNSNTCTGHM